SWDLAIDHRWKWVLNQIRSTSSIREFLKFPSHTAGFKAACDVTSNDSKFVTVVNPNLLIQRYRLRLRSGLQLKHLCRVRVFTNKGRYLSARHSVLDAIGFGEGFVVYRDPKLCVMATRYKNRPFAKWRLVLRRNHLVMR